MAFSSNSGSGAMSDINVTPLVDVLLVLLIIFMVTAPPLSYQIQVDLPQKTNIPPPKIENPPEPIRIRIDAGGNVTWNGSDASMKALVPLMEVEGAKETARQPTIEIETDPEADYEALAKVLARTKNAGLVKISFVEPGKGS